MSSTMTRGELAKKIACRLFELVCADNEDADRHLAEIWNEINPDHSEIWTEFRGRFMKLEDDFNG
jgi:hypothetical protein